jgi:hypothetical protein
MPGTTRLAARLDDLLARYDRVSAAKEKQALHVEILKAYAALTAITNPNGEAVNGHTLRSSQYIVNGFWVTGACGFLAFALVGMTHGFESYYMAFPVAPPEPGFTLPNLHAHALVFLLPAFWGALGAAISLTMKIAEHARKNTFDTRKLRGQLSRIGLGAVLAAAVVHLFRDQLGMAESSLGANAIAFLAGLGVQPMYDALDAVLVRVSQQIAKLDPARDGAGPGVGKPV